MTSDRPSLETYLFNSNFPQKLYVILDTESADIICWNEKGSSFRVIDQDKFTDEIGPKYFRRKLTRYPFTSFRIDLSVDTKMASFQRQLNLYGFRRITKGPESGAYYHPKFLRGRRDLVSEIKRVPGKPSSRKINQTLLQEARPPLSMKLAGINSLNLTPVLISEDGIQYLNLPPSAFPFSLFPEQNAPLLLQASSYRQILPKQAWHLNKMQILMFSPSLFFKRSVILAALSVSFISDQVE